MSDGFRPNASPEMALARAREILASRGVADTVALLGVRGFFGAMGTSPGNDLGIYDDAVFLVTPERCDGYVFNTDPSRYSPPNVALKPGVTRYKPGTHTSPLTHESYAALVQSGLPGEVAWVIARPDTIDDYREFAKAPGVALGRRFDTIQEYRDALRSMGGRLNADGSIEWPMKEHINIHRGGDTDPGSRGCQTVHPSVWPGFIRAVYDELERRGQPYVPYLLIEAADLRAPA
jgi:lysozyme